VFACVKANPAGGLRSTLTWAALRHVEQLRAAGREMGATESRDPVVQMAGALVYIGRRPSGRQ